jgi:hypothetical protein
LQAAGITVASSHPVSRHLFRLAAALLVVILSCSRGTTHAQQAAAPYGSRLAPAPPGEGGDLLVIGPPQLCADSMYELQLRRFVANSGMLFALRGPAGPSTCEWQVDALREGTYDAVILRRADSQIVATASRTLLARGAIAVMRLTLTTIEVEGQITVNGIAPSDALLLFSASSGFKRWDVPVAEDGSYSANLDRDDSGLFCIYLKRARREAIGMVLVRCQSFAHGLQRFDADLSLSPGVIRVRVAPLAQGPRGDWSSLVVVVQHADRLWSGNGFRATAGFTGEYLDAKFQDYDVRVETSSSHKILARARVALSAEQAVQDVQLFIPPASLTCNEGWWTAC